MGTPRGTHYCFLANNKCLSVGDGAHENPKNSTSSFRGTPASTAREIRYHFAGIYMGKVIKSPFLREWWIALARRDERHVISYISHYLYRTTSSVSAAKRAIKWHLHTAEPPSPTGEGFYFAHITPSQFELKFVRGYYEPLVFLLTTYLRIGIMNMWISFQSR